MTLSQTSWTSRADSLRSFTSTPGPIILELERELRSAVYMLAVENGNLRTCGGHIARGILIRRSGVAPDGN